MPTLNKAQLLHQVIAHLETALSQAQQAAQTAYEAATDEENIAENKYDTLGLEASYLATGQAREDALRAERNRSLLRLGVAGLGAMQAMMFAEALYLDTANQMAPATRDFFRWITFLVSTPVVFFSGWPFLEGMVRELRQRRPGMDTLVATSVLLAYFASFAETLRGGTHVWYDAAVMFVLFLLAARFLELMARRQARRNAYLDAIRHWARHGGASSFALPLATSAPRSST